MSKYRPLREVAEALGMSRKRILQLVANGTLPAVRFPRGQWLVKESDLIAVLESNRNSSPALQPA